MIADTLSRGRVLPHALLHAVGLAVIYFLPALSHMLAVPLFYMEPMRLFVVLAIAHSVRANAYLLALSLPAFSFLVSGHPEAMRMAIISAELLVNVWLFYWLYAYLRRVALTALLSIAISKALYYGAKAALIGLGIYATPFMVGIPLGVQAVTALVFAVYLAVTLRDGAK